MLKPIFEIGDLVSLLDKKNRKRLIRQKNYFVESTDDLGVGIIIDKLEELFVFPNGLQIKNIWIKILNELQRRI